METLILTIATPDGKVLETFTAHLRTFSTGSRGYGANGKVALPDGNRLQASCNLTIIGSKAAAAK